MSTSEKKNMLRFIALSTLGAILLLLIILIVYPKPLSILDFFALHWLPLILVTILLFTLPLLLLKNFNTLLVKKAQEEELNKVNPLGDFHNFHDFLTNSNQILGKANPDEFMIVFLHIKKYSQYLDLYGTEFDTRITKFISELIKRIHGPFGTYYAAKLETGEFIILSSFIAENDLCNYYQTGQPPYISAFLENATSDRSLVEYNIGAYYISDPSMGIHTALDFAKKAQVFDQNNTGNSVNFFTSTMKEEQDKYAQYTLNMKSAIEKGEFIPYLQPKLNISNNVVEGAELLVRWISSNGIIPPNDFIPVFEKSGLILDLDLHMLRQACQIQRDLDWNIPIGINLSSLTLSNPTIIDQIVNIAKKYKISHNLLELEIIESIISEEKELIIPTIKKLKELGFTIVLDDYGSESSSLTALYDVPADIVKLDRNFIHTLNIPKGIVLVESIIVTLERIGIQSVAEGVETREQIELLKAIDCHCAQGYYFAKPMPLADFKVFWHSMKANNKSKLQ